MGRKCRPRYAARRAVGLLGAKVNLVLAVLIANDLHRLDLKSRGGVGSIEATDYRPARSRGVQSSPGRRAGRQSLRAALRCRRQLLATARAAALRLVAILADRQCRTVAANGEGLLWRTILRCSHDDRHNRPRRPPRALDVGELPAAPAPGWRLWIGLLGPGVVLAGTSIGSGEWLFGPAVSAQYGGTLLWLASISIMLQVFCNLMMMRYTLYCGEPIIVGGLADRARSEVLDHRSTCCWTSLRSGRTTPRTPPCRWPPPSWAICPANGTLRIAGYVMTESQLVRGAGLRDLRAGVRAA